MKNLFKIIIVSVLLFSSLNSNGGINELIEDADNDDYYYGMTDYGALWTVYDFSGTDNPETLTIDYPLQQRGVKVYVVEDINDFIFSNDTICMHCSIFIYMLYSIF